MKIIHCKFDKQQKTALKLLLATLLFCIGYIISAITFLKPLSEEQFKYYEKLASNIYKQSDKTKIEIPNDIKINISPTNITVCSSNIIGEKGKVVAIISDDQLILTRDLETPKIIFVSTLSGLLFLILIYLITYIINTIILKN